MRVIFAFILFALFIPDPILCQETEINAFDKSGRKTGYWKINYDNGNIRYEGFFFEDKPVGEFKRYYSGGLLQALMNFSGDGKHAYVKFYYENGKPAAEGKFIERLKDSTWNYYSEHDSHLTMKENYSSGQRWGESIKYYRNKQVSELVNYENDLRNGIWKQYFESGILRLKSTYQDDKREGVFQTWSHEGLPSVKGYYKKGVMHGEWVYFNEKGAIEIVAEYVDGVLLPNEEIERRQEEFSRRVEESIGKFSEPEKF